MLFSVLQWHDPRFLYIVDTPGFPEAESEQEIVVYEIFL